MDKASHFPKTMRLVMKSELNKKIELTKIKSYILKFCPFKKSARFVFILMTRYDIINENFPIDE